VTRSNLPAAGWAWPALIGLLTLVALLGPQLAPHDVVAPNFRLRLAPPEWSHPLGTDHLGRDIASRVLAGARATLGMSFAIATLATILGVAVGILSVMAGRWADAVLTRLAEIVQTLPAFVLAVTVSAAFGASSIGIVATFAMLNWTTHARLTRGLVRSIDMREHVTVARLYALPPWLIARRHFLPLVVPPLLVTWSENWSRAILAISALGFLGLGIPPPEPEWGAMLSDGRSYMSAAPLVMLGPGLAVVISVLIINLFGDWLRDRLALDETRAA
jgi:ABC-type dipeptide/oligopeptide/nickel transport system permease subunit